MLEFEQHFSNYSTQDLNEFFKVPKTLFDYLGFARYKLLPSFSQRGKSHCHLSFYHGIRRNAKMELSAPKINQSIEAQNKYYYPEGKYKK